MKDSIMQREVNIYDIQTVLKNNKKEIINQI